MSALALKLNFLYLLSFSSLDTSLKMNKNRNGGPTYLHQLYFLSLRDRNAYTLQVKGREGMKEKGRSAFTLSY